MEDSEVIASGSEPADDLDPTATTTTTTSNGLLDADGDADDDIIKAPAPDPMTTSGLFSRDLDLQSGGEDTETTSTSNVSQSGDTLGGFGMTDSFIIHTEEDLSLRSGEQQDFPALDDGLGTCSGMTDSFMQITNGAPPTSDDAEREAVLVDLGQPSQTAASSSTTSNELGDNGLASQAAIFGEDLEGSQERLVHGEGEGGDVHHPGHPVTSDPRPPDADALIHTAPPPPSSHAEEQGRGYNPFLDERAPGQDLASGAPNPFQPDEASEEASEDEDEDENSQIEHLEVVERKTEESRSVTAVSEEEEGVVEMKEEVPQPEGHAAKVTTEEAPADLIQTDHALDTAAAVGAAAPFDDDDVGDDAITPEVDVRSALTEAQAVADTSAEPPLDTPAKQPEPEPEPAGEEPPKPVATVVPQPIPDSTPKEEEKSAQPTAAKPAPKSPRKLPVSPAKPATTPTKASTASPASKQRPPSVSLSSSGSRPSSARSAKKEEGAPSKTTPTARPGSAATGKTGTKDASKPATQAASRPNGLKTDPSKSRSRASSSPSARPSSGKTLTAPKTLSTAKGGLSSPRTPPGSASPASSASGSVSSPRKSEVKSKIGSLDNAAHSPGGGNVKILSKKPDLSNVQSKIGSKDKIDHKPGGGKVKIETKKIELGGVRSKIGSLDNAKHTPGGGDKKIERQKLQWTVTSRVGSLDNAHHTPGGGDKKIEVKKLDWKGQSKVGSLDNAKHTPGGGDKKIETRKLDFKEKATAKVGSLDTTGARSEPSSEEQELATESSPSEKTQD